jgi:hypothetical protein
LKRLDDYIVFPHFALRGLAESGEEGLFYFVVCSDFWRFLSGASEKAYRSHFAGYLLEASGLFPKYDLIWPGSREDRLFEQAAAAATGYGLPVQDDSIVLAPGAGEFIGFKRVLPHGMEFRDGEEFVRFTPSAVECVEGESSWQHAGGPALLGWGLDGEGRVCAFYEQASGFKPPEEFKLLRFLNEEEKAAEAAALNMLAWLDLPAKSPRLKA